MAEELEQSSGKFSQNESARALTFLWKGFSVDYFRVWLLPMFDINKTGSVTSINSAFWQNIKITF